MGALTINRKRGNNDLFSLNCKTHVSDCSNFDHISKKIKFLTPPNQALPCKSTVSRFFKYPVSINPIRREVHAPCRKSRIGCNPNSCFSACEMGNFWSKKWSGSSSRSGGDRFEYSKNDEEVVEVIEVDDDSGRESGSDRSGIEEVEKCDLLGKEWKEEDGFVQILDDFDGKTGSDVGKKLDSLALNPSSDCSFYVPLYKTLLGLVDKTSDKLKRIGHEILFTEKQRETYNLLRRRKEVDRVDEGLTKEAFVPLTEEEKVEVSRALSNLNRRRILVTHVNSNIDITGEILQCLKPKKWLNDEVINVYLELLKEREKREPQKFLTCHFFNTFFYKKLINGKGGYNYQSVRRWTSQRKLGYSLFECDKIFVPIHKEIHWCLAVINKKNKKFQYLDSLGGRDTQVLKVLARYFVDEVKDKSGKDIDVSSWEQEFVEDLPEQKNGFDCGVFMIKYADFYSRDIGLCFNQENMSYFRLRTAKEILRLKAN